ncbi:MAG: hypothetical protein ACKO38_06740, partial [Planctomycetota bacterium]
DGVERLEAGVANATAFLGSNRGTASEAGLKVTGAKLGWVMVERTAPASAKYALAGSGTASLVGITGLTLSGTAEVQVTRMDAAVNETIATPGGSVAVVFPTSAATTRVAGTLDLATPIATLSGAFAIEATGASPQREVLIGATDVTGFVGNAGGAGAADDVGVSLRDGTLTAYLSPSGTYAFDASAAAGLVGVDGVTFSGTIKAQKNTTGAAINRSLTIDGVAQTLNLPKDAERVAGTLTAAIDGYVEISGALEMVRTASTVKLADGSNVDVSLLKFSGTGLSGFVGINGPASNSDAMGVSISGVDFGFVLASPSDDLGGTDLRRWTAARAKANSAGLVGVDAVTGTLTGLQLSFNRGSGTLNGAEQTTAIDFSGAPIGFGTPTNPETSLNFSDKLLRLSATADITVGSFVKLAGSIAISKSVTTLELSDSTSLEANVLSIGGSNLSGFAGLNAGTAGAVGLSLEGIDFALAMATDAADSSRSWTSLDAVAANAELTGVSGFEIAASNLAIEVNRADENDVVVDYAATPLSIDIGGGASRSLDLDGSLGDTTFVKGHLSLKAMGLFRVAGDATLRKSLGTVALVDGTTTVVDLLTFGISNAQAFAGVSNAGGEHGLTIGSANVALAIATDAAEPTRKWQAIKATAANVSAVGLNAVELSATNLAVEINRPDSSGAVVDWSRLPLTVTEGLNPLTIDLDGQQGALAWARGQLTLNVGGFFRVTGEFAVEKSTRTVTLSDASKSQVEVDLLTVGARRVEAFAGVKADSANAADRVGLKLSGVEFALAMASTTTTPSRQWTALSANATQVEFQGVDESVAKFSARNFAVSINRPDQDGANGVVIDFAAAPLTVAT